MQAKRILHELYIGIAIYCVPFMLLGILLMRPLWIFELSVIVGGLGACLQARSIYKTLDVALDLPKGKAKAYATGKSVLRLIFCLALMAIGMIIDWVSFVGVVIGLIGLKISAFLNPFLDKFLVKKGIYEPETPAPLKTPEEIDEEMAAELEEDADEDLIRP